MYSLLCDGHITMKFHYSLKYSFWFLFYRPWTESLTTDNMVVFIAWWIDTFHWWIFRSIKKFPSVCVCVPVPMHHVLAPTWWVHMAYSIHCPVSNIQSFGKLSVVIFMSDTTFCSNGKQCGTFYRTQVNIHSINILVQRPCRTNGILCIESHQFNYFSTIQLSVPLTECN